MVVVVVETAATFGNVVVVDVVAVDEARVALGWRLAVI